MNPDLAHDLTQHLSGDVRFDSFTRALYSTDASNYQIEPIGVVLPRDADDVQAVLEITARHNAPVLPRGGGSSLAGQAVGHAVVLDCSKYMRGLVEINSHEHFARVQPGLVCDALNAALKPHGLMFPTEPASSNRATLGGIIANNATGAHSVLYGMTIDHLLSARTCLADASEYRFAETETRLFAADPRSSATDLPSRVSALVARYEPLIRERYPKTWRRSSGYSLNYLLPHSHTPTRPSNWYSSDPYPPLTGFNPAWGGVNPARGGVNLAKLLAGSEGTLAVITEATLNLVPLPKHTALCIVHFDSLAAAADATPIILECRPSAVELIDRMLIDLTRSVPGFAPKLTFVEGNPAAILIVEFYGDSESHLLSQIDMLETRLRSTGVARTFVRALTPKQQSDVWGIRKVGLGLLASMRSAAKPTAFMEDVAVPVEKLGNYVRFTERLFAEHGVQSGYYAHASAGCLHIRPILNLKSSADIAKMKSMSAAVLNVVVEIGGAMSGEHGDGLARSCWNGKLFGPELYEAFRELKCIFDPLNRLNPGKIVEAQDLTDNLRYGPDYRTITVDTTLSFEREHGFAAAVEQCNGMGVCRKADGVMCPSYHATRDEEHSTRGRANALRAALSGRLPPAELTSPRLAAALDLCLECKACKTECPSGVDVAKIKYEWLAHYQSVHGIPLRSRLFAQIHRLSRLACRFSFVANTLLQSPLVRRLNERVLGLTRHRALPPFAPQTFRQQFANNQLPTPPQSAAVRVTNNHSSITNYQLQIIDNPVVLFTDTFTNFNHPAIGLAAVKVLAAAGYTVRLADHGCCGRPMISKGLLAEAKQSAMRMVEALASFAEPGIPIVGLEPSCLLTLRDEYLDLLPNEPRARRVADNAWLIEEFISARADQFKPLFLNTQFSHAPIRVLFHGHCYQKSLTGTASLKTMLELPGRPVNEIDTGCCGMAGAFGYEAEHYAISMKIGEDRLLPAVRAASPQTLIAASGVSCRHQIEHGAGRVARHPVELLADALVV